MTSVQTVVELSLAVVFVVSAGLKLASPMATAPLLAQLHITRPSAQTVSITIAGAELSVATAIYVWPLWGLVGAGILLVIFSTVVIFLMRQGSRPRCGCLGDVGVARVGGVHLARNLALIAAVFVALGAPEDRPFAALLPAVTLAFLVLLVPEAIEILREFRANVRNELKGVYLHPAHDLQADYPAPQGAATLTAASDIFP